MLGGGHAVNTVRVFVEPTGRRIAPFDDPIGETPVLNRPLREWQARAFSEAGLVPIPSLQPPCLVIPDTLFASGSALRAFVDGAEGQDAVFVLAPSAFARWTTCVQPGVRETEDGFLFEAIRFVTTAGSTPRPVVVDPEEQVLELAAPRQFSGTEPGVIGLPRRPVMTLHHWVHVLWVNQIAGAYEATAAPRWKTTSRMVGAALRARSTNRWKVLRSLSSHGKGCDIHPTAIIEGSTLGDGVTVGANARILLSRIGDGSTILSDAHVEFSVLGERSWITQQSFLRFCVLYPGAVAGGLTQQSVFGREAMTTTASIYDLNIERDIRVELDGVLHSTGQQFLGAALGHRARVMGGVGVGSGRAIPNDYLVIGEPGRAVMRTPPGLAEAGPLLVQDGELRPLRESQ
jgi:carbonic anhydrase/acetyltransferase-like protein (isoleucine patch superfamily)